MAIRLRNLSDRCTRPITMMGRVHRFMLVVLALLIVGGAAVWLDSRYAKRDVHLTSGDWSWAVTSHNGRLEWTGFKQVAEDESYVNGRMRYLSIELTLLTLAVLVYVWGWETYRRKQVTGFPLDNDTAIRK